MEQMCGYVFSARIVFFLCSIFLNSIQFLTTTLIFWHIRKLHKYIKWNKIRVGILKCVCIRYSWLKHEIRSLSSIFATIQWALSTHIPTLHMDMCVYKHLIATLIEINHILYYNFPTQLLCSLLFYTLVIYILYAP